MADFSYRLDSGVHILKSAGVAQMQMMVRNKKEFFTDFIYNEAKAQALKVVVNGSFIDLSTLSSVAVKWYSDPLDAAESSPVGQVIQDSKLVAGSSSTGKFNFSQDTCSTQKFSAGLGNPPLTACAAIGGVAPILVNGMPCGKHNLYKPDVPPGAPLTGDVSAKFKPFLTQKSNKMFADLLARGREVGKVAIGHSKAHQRLVIAVQEHGKMGPDADGIRRLFVGAGVDNAVFLDCSDSATLFYGGRFLVKPGTNKNEFLTVAVGFK